MLDRGSGTTRSCGLVGGECGLAGGRVSLGVGFETILRDAQMSVFSCLPSEQDIELSSYSTMPT